VAQNPDLDFNAIAETLRESVGLLLRRLRQLPAEGELTLPESAALTRLDRGGPTTASALARLERISPQSIGATLAALEARGLVERRSDPHDGRRVVLSVTEAGHKTMRNRRNARTEHLARALSTGFSRPELDLLTAAAPLLERLALNI
jgi:DNA-binding MarR family transcriptional regulator